MMNSKFISQIDVRSAKFPPNPKSNGSERKSRDKAPITDDESIKEYVDERIKDSFDDDSESRSVSFGHKNRNDKKIRSLIIMQFCNLEC